MGFGLAVGSYAEHSRVVHRLNSGLGTWSIRSGTSQTLSAMDLTVCSQPLTFDKQHSPRQAAYLLCPRHSRIRRVQDTYVAKARKIMKTETSDIDASVHPATQASMQTAWASFIDRMGERVSRMPDGSDVGIAVQTRIAPNTVTANFTCGNPHQR